MELITREIEINDSLAKFYQELDIDDEKRLVRGSKNPPDYLVIKHEKLKLENEKKKMQEM